MKLYKTIAWIVLVMSLINIITMVSSIKGYRDDQFIVKVAPKEESTLSNQPIKQFEGAALYFKGDMEIKNFYGGKEYYYLRKQKKQFV